MENLKKRSVLPLLFAAMFFGSCETEKTTDITQPLVAPPIVPMKKPIGGGGGTASYRGSACVSDATVLGVNNKVSHTGSLPPEGGAREASLLTESLPGLLSCEVLHAATVGQGDRVSSEASAGNVVLLCGLNTIQVRMVMARAVAACNQEPAASCEIVGLVVNGIPIDVSSQPNTTVPLLNGCIVVNEQVRSGSNDITVNALRVTVTGVADVIVASASAGITCEGQPPCGECGDFVTGGGWITTQSGAHGNFGVAGGIRNGEFWGHLNYIDHGPSGPHVKGTGVTGYFIIDETTRRIEGTCEIDGVGGYTYRVVVSDNGEPSTNDWFQIELSNGYWAGGLLQGGNIQLHKPCR